MKVSSRGRLIKANRNYFDEDDRAAIPATSPVKKSGNGKVKKITRGSGSPIQIKSIEHMTQIAKTAPTRKSRRWQGSPAPVPPKPCLNPSTTKEFNKEVARNEPQKKTAHNNSTLIDIGLEHSRWQDMKCSLGLVGKCVDAEVAEYLLNWFRKTAPPVYHKKALEGTLDRSYMQNMLEKANPINFHTRESNDVPELDASSRCSQNMSTAVPCTLENDTNDHKLHLTCINICEEQDGQDFNHSDDVPLEEKIYKFNAPTDYASKQNTEVNTDAIVDISSVKQGKGPEQSSSLTEASSTDSKTDGTDGTTSETPADTVHGPDRSSEPSKSKTPKKQGTKSKYPESMAMFTKTEDGNFKCNSCNAVLTSKAGCRYHEQRHCNNKSLHCEVCGKIFTNMRALTTHSKSHQTLLQCDFCSFTSRVKKLLQVHKKENHKEAMEKRRKEDIFKNGHERFMCDACGKSYARRQALKEHQRLKHSPVPQDRHVCSICGKSYMLKASLNVHYKNHEAPQHQCPQCGKKFYVNSTLQLHLNRVHLNVQKYQCEDCGRRFKVKMHMLEHRYSQHLHVRPFKCSDPHCTKAFYSRRHQIVHSRIHTGEKPIKCKLCDYSCRQTAALKWHMQKHANPQQQPKQAKTKEKLPVKQEMVIYEVKIKDNPGIKLQGQNGQDVPNNHDVSEDQNDQYFDNLDVKFQGQGGQDKPSELVGKFQSQNSQDELRSLSIKFEGHNSHGDHVYSVSHQNKGHHGNEIITDQPDGNIILTDVKHVEETVVIDGIAPETVGQESLIVMQPSVSEPGFVTLLNESTGHYQGAAGLLQPAPITDLHSIQLEQTVELQEVDIPYST